MRRPRPSQVILAAGLGVLLVGAVVIGVPWYSAMRWQGSPEAVRAERNADAPTLIQVTPTPSGATASTSTNVSAARSTEAPAAAQIAPGQAATQSTDPQTPQTAVVAPPQLSTPIALNANIAVAPTATP